VSFFISFGLFADQRTYYKIDESPANLEKEGFYFIENDIDKGSERFGAIYSIVYPSTYKVNYTFKKININISEGEKQLFSSQISACNFDSNFELNKYLNSNFHYFMDSDKLVSLSLSYEHNSSSEVYSLFISDITQMIVKDDWLQVYKLINNGNGSVVSSLPCQS